MKKRERNKKKGKIKEERRQEKGEKKPEEKMKSWLDGFKRCLLILSASWSKTYLEKEM